VGQGLGAEAPPGPRNLALGLGKRLTLRGYIILDHLVKLG
jgi:hypothetical protein